MNPAIHFIIFTACVAIEYFLFGYQVALIRNNKKPLNHLVLIFILLGLIGFLSGFQVIGALK